MEIIEKFKNLKDENFNDFLNEFQEYIKSIEDEYYKCHFLVKILDIIYIDDNINYDVQVNFIRSLNKEIKDLYFKIGLDAYKTLYLYKDVGHIVKHIPSNTLFKICNISVHQNVLYDEHLYGYHTHECEATQGII